MKKLFKDLLVKNGIEVVEKPGFMVNHNSSTPVLKMVAKYENIGQQKRRIDEELKVFINITKNKCISFKDSMEIQIHVNDNNIIINRWSYSNNDWIELSIPIDMIVD